MRRRMFLLAVLLGAELIASGGAAIAQESPNFKLREHVLNSGGNPDGGSVLASPNFRIRLDAIGEDVTGAGLLSTSWRMDPGFLSAYPPPGEVTVVRFDLDGATLLWNPERSVGTYSLYRGIVDDFLPAYGLCSQVGLFDETAADSDVPSVGAAFFYLVTARNHLAEEGTKGFDSSGTERPNPNPCP